MNAAHSRIDNRVKWKCAFLWAFILLIAAPFVRSLQRWIANEIGRWVFMWGTLAFIAGAGAIVFIFAYRMEAFRRRSVIIGTSSTVVILTILAIGLRFNPEEAVHIIQYSVLTILLSWAMKDRLNTLSGHVFSVLLSSLVAVLDEIVQCFSPERVGDLRDVGLNIAIIAAVQIGIFIGLARDKKQITDSDLGQKRRRSFIKSFAAAILGIDWILRTGNTFGLPDSKEKTLKIAFLTDIHADDDVVIKKKLDRLAKAVNKETPDLVVLGGDLITGGLEGDYLKIADRWDVYQDFHSKITTTKLPVIGNHDLKKGKTSQDSRSEFKNRLNLNNTYYSLELAGVYFIVLDSIELLGEAVAYRGFVGSEQMEWIRSTLKSIPLGAPLVLVTHMPILTAFFQAAYGAEFAAPPDKILINGKEVLSLFEGLNLILVLQGHLHISERINWRGIEFVTGGAVSGGWWKGPWHGTREGFSMINIQSKYINWRYKNI